MAERTAVILAGGRSRRMGRDKALLPFAGYATLAEYQYRRLQPLFDRVYLSAKESKFPFDAPLIPDRREGHSPLIALESIFATLDLPEIFLLAVDLPFVDTPTIERLQSAARSHPKAQAVVPRSPHGLEPLCAVYRRSLLPEIRRMLEEDRHRLQTLLARSDTLEVAFDRSDPFANLNRPQEYEKAKKVLSAKC